MRLLLDTLTVQKDGNAPSENEDACAHSGGPVLHAAVADGATESLFSGLWARLLARAFTGGGLGDARSLVDALPGLQRAWHQEVSRKELPWYAQEKLQDGAFATLLGVRLEAGRWEALAVGDSCLFQVREEALAHCFPLEASARFDSRPFLLSTHVRRNTGVDAQVRVASGEARAGDTLLLMTDALACWFLAEHERGQSPWRVLPGDSPEDFAAFIAGLRARKAIRNDDCTLLRLRVEAE